eukprot:m.135254 g.135254  ORF g.135254 m.135254 type:complete len:73 (+) comp13972_c1_seq7:4127-4345(+)
MSPFASRRMVGDPIKICEGSECHTTSFRPSVVSLISNATQHVKEITSSVATIIVIVMEKNSRVLDLLCEQMR